MRSFDPTSVERPKETIDLRQYLAAPLAVLILLLVAYLPALFLAPLGDEQFLLAWAGDPKGAVYGNGEFLGFNGLFPADLWGMLTPVSMKLTHWAAFGTVVIWRISSLFIHLITASVLYFVFHRLFGSALIALLGAITFAVWPTNVEAVAWIGGRGALLAGMFTALAMLAYLKSREVSQGAYGSWELVPGAVLVIIATISFALGEYASGMVWTSAGLFALTETALWFSTPRDQRQHGTFCLVSPLLPIFVAACTLAAGAVYTKWAQTAAPIFGWREAGTVFGAMWMPVAAFHHTQLFLILLIPLGILIVAAFAVDRSVRWKVSLMVVWSFVAAIPLFGQIETHSLLGMHLLYVACIPVCALLGFGAAAVHHSFSRLLPVSLPVSCVLAAILVIIAITQDWKQIGRYSSGGRTAAALQNALRAQTGTGGGRVLVADMPSGFALSPMFDTEDGLAVMDATTGLLASNQVSGGALKDSLKGFDVKIPLLRYDAGSKALLPMEISSDRSGKAQFTAGQLAELSQPPIAYLKTTSLDGGVLQIKSETKTTGPVLRIRADWLSQLGEDFLWVDAKIDGANEASASVDVYWTSSLHPEYDLTRRKESTKAVMSDGSYHRHYFPLRSLGWVTGGQPQQLTIGFPAGSTVHIKGLGTAERLALMPVFYPKTNNRTVPGIAAPNYRFPPDRALGLDVLPPESKGLPTELSAMKVDKATGLLAEISMPDKDFENPNGNRLSGVTYKTVHMNLKAGTADLPIEDLPKTAIYAVRAVAMDKKHNWLGNFSDTSYVFIQRPNRLGWNTQ